MIRSDPREDDDLVRTTRRAPLSRLQGLRLRGCGHTGLLAHLAENVVYTVHWRYGTERDGIKLRPQCGCQNHPLALLSSPPRSTSLIMKFAAFIGAFILGATLQAFAQVTDAAKALEILTDLKRAPTQVARLNILSNNRDVSGHLWRYPSNLSFDVLTLSVSSGCSILPRWVRVLVEPRLSRALPTSPLCSPTAWPWLWSKWRK